MTDKDRIQILQKLNIETLSQIRDETEGLFTRYGLDNSDVNLTLKRLFWYLGSRSQAVTFLISHGYSWDAEIILRSFYETAVKILFISCAPQDSKSILIDEFWHGLGPIMDKKAARKASFAQDMFEDGSISAAVFKMLQDSDVLNLNITGSKSDRKRLEQKWSFSEIIDYLEKRATEGEPLKGIKSLLHIYGMASHLIHADKIAMDLMYDRAIRKTEERQILEVSHVIRIMSDQVNISWLCADGLRRHFRGEFINVPDIYYNFKKIGILSNHFRTNFDQSQREFYRKYTDEN